MHGDPSLTPAPVDVDPWAVLEALPAGVVVLDEAHNVAWCNARAGALLAVEAQALMGEPEAALRARCAQRALVTERSAGDGGVVVVRGDADRDVTRAAFLADAGDRLAGSLNLDRTLGRIVDLAVPHLADACLLSFVEDHELRRVGAVARNGVTEQWQEGGLPVGAAVEAAARVRRSNSSELHAAVPSEQLAALVPEGAPWSSLREEARSAMVVPVRARAEAIGALVLLGGPARQPYGLRDVELAEAFARRAAVALDNASLYRDRSVVAEMLQRSLLPPRLPCIPHLEIGAAYRPLIRTSDIGGDFYDVFQTAPDVWAVAVGDIGGKGITAAAVTGLARHTIRAAAMQAPAPSDVLRALNDVIAADEANRLCTVVLAQVVPSPDGAAVTVAAGGHPPPLVVRQDGGVGEVDVRGTLLGAFADVELTDRRVRLDPGDALVLYTDGVTEARAGREEFGDTRLHEVLTSSAGLRAETMAERLLQEVVDFVRNAPTDDIAVVVVRVPGSGGG